MPSPSKSTKKQQQQQRSSSATKKKRFPSTTKNHSSSSIVGESSSHRFCLDILTKPSTLAFLVSLFILMVSRMSCFHVHYGLSANMNNIEYDRGFQPKMGSDGMIDYHFRARGKISLDAKAQTILRDNPDIKLNELDLGLVYTEEEFGANPGNLGGTSMISGNSRGMLGKSGSDTIFRVTGDMIEKALEKEAASRPKPSSRPKPYDIEL